MAEQKLKTLDIMMVSRDPIRHLVAGQLQPLANRTWRADLPERSAEEIDYVFPPLITDEDYRHDPYKKIFRELDAAETGARMRRLGRGVLVTASSKDLGTGHGSDLIGYALVRNNVSGNFAERAIKTYLKRQPPYVWVQSINVDPDYQGQGVGSALIMSAANIFDTYQPSTAYVYDENPNARNYFENLGYFSTQSRSTIIEDRFGPNSRAAYQYRLQAAQIGDVALQAARIVEDKNLHVAIESFTPN